MSWHARSRVLAKQRRAPEPAPEPRPAVLPPRRPRPQRLQCPPGWHQVPEVAPQDAEAGWTPDVAWSTWRLYRTTRDEAYAAGYRVYERARRRARRATETPA